VVNFSADSNTDLHLNRHVRHSFNTMASFFLLQLQEISLPYPSRDKLLS